MVWYRHCCVCLDILYLNKQRLAAFEELEKLKNEKDELLERINQLEEESQIVIKKGFYFYFFDLWWDVM